MIITDDYNGHQAGDDCLRRIAKTLEDTLKRPGDFAARYGGEEFIILLPGTDEQGAAHVAAMLQANVINLNIPYIPGEHEPVVSISIGCATLIPNEKLNPEHLIKLADDKLYLAKESRLNQFPLNQLSHLA